MLDIPTVPDDPIIVDVPGQGVVETLGIGSGSVGLSPGVPTSVAPSGIAPPLADPGTNPVVVEAPVVDNPIVPRALPDALDAQAVDIVELDIDPPSNVDVDPVTPMPDPAVPVLVIDPGVPVPIAPAPMQGVVLIIGLSPPVFSSVAPKGIPVPCEGALDDVAPRGDVAPIPGVGATCAKLGLLLKIIRIVAMARPCRIDSSLNLSATSK